MSEAITRTKTSIDELIKIIKKETPGTKEINYYSGKKIKEQKLFALSSRLQDNCTYIVCTAVEFQAKDRTTVFSELNFGSEIGFIFIDCMLPLIRFANSNFGICYFYKTELSNSITFDSCKTRSIRFFNCKASHIKIRNCITEDVYASNSSIGNLEFYESKIRVLQLDKSTSNYQRLNKTQTSSVKISNSTTGYVYIDDGSKTGPIEILHSHLASLYVIGNYFSLKTLNATIPTIEFEQCFINCLEWGSGTKSELYVTNCTINIFKINTANVSKESTISFIKTKMAIIDIKNSLVQGQLNFRNVALNRKFFSWYSIDDFLARSFAEEREKEIYEARRELLLCHEASYKDVLKGYKKDDIYKEPSKVIIAYSSLGKTEFTDFELVASKIVFCHSKIVEIFVSGANFREGKILTFNSRNDIDELEQKISFYSQIKKVYESQGDVFESIIYHSIVSDLRKELIKKKIGIKNSDSLFKKALTFFFRRKNNHLGDKLDLLTLTLNKISNNHGESWSHALRFLLISSIVIFIPFIWSFKYHLDLSLLFYGKGWKFITDPEPFFIYGKYYFSFLNPVRPLDYIVKYEHIKQVNASNIFWDFLGRLTVGYSIYQFVVAFRKHGKK